MISHSKERCVSCAHLCAITRMAEVQKFSRVSFHRYEALLRGLLQDLKRIPVFGITGHGV